MTAGPAGTECTDEGGPQRHDLSTRGNQSNGGTNWRTPSTQRGIDEHERVGDDFAISIEIYDSYGRTVKRINENAYKINSPYDQILWNISEDSSSIVTSNYFYRIFAKSLTTNYQATGIGRIVSVK